MKKQEYAKANKEWLAEKTKEEGVREIPGGIYYKVLKEGLGDGQVLAAGNTGRIHAHLRDRAAGDCLSFTITGHQDVYCVYL